MVSPSRKLVDTSSPALKLEWLAVKRVLGLELMIQLMGISVSSARRYVAGTRATPNAVAARLHFLTFVLGQLAGAYDDVGIQRWFHRPRRFLNGNTPAQLLERDWQPDDDGPRQVQDVAATLGLRVGTERSGVCTGGSKNCSGAVRRGAIG